MLSPKINHAKSSDSKPNKPFRKLRLLTVVIKELKAEIKKLVSDIKWKDNSIIIYEHLLLDLQLKNAIGTDDDPTPINDLILGCKDSISFIKKERSDLLEKYHYKMSQLQTRKARLHPTSQ